MLAPREACSLTQTAVPRISCCPAGQEDAFAQRIMDAGGVVIQPLFPWLWAGGEVAAHRSLKGVGTGELLNPTQSGLQVCTLRKTSKAGLLVCAVITTCQGSTATGSMLSTTSCRLNHWTACPVHPTMLPWGVVLP